MAFFAPIPTSMSDITFDRKSGRFVGISDHDLDVWQRTWRTCDIRTLISIAEVTVKHQPEVYPASTIWRRMLCTKVFPYGKEIIGSIPLRIETESDSVEKRNPTTVKLSGLGGEAPKDVDSDSHILTHLAPALSIVNKDLIGNLMSAGYVKLNRQALQLALVEPKLFVFLCNLAALARFNGNGFNPHKLAVGQVFIAESEPFGLTRKEYRILKARSLALGIASFEWKGKGTVATFTSDNFIILDEMSPRIGCELRPFKKGPDVGPDEGQFKARNINDLDCEECELRARWGPDEGQIGARSSYIQKEGKEQRKKETKKVAALASADADRLVTLFFSDLAKRNAAAKKPSNLTPSLTAMQRLIDLHGLPCVEHTIAMLPETFYAVHVNTVLALSKKFIQCCGYVQDLAGKDKAASLRPAKHASYTTAEGVSSIVDRMEIVE